MPYKDKEKQKEYMRNWHKKHKDYDINYYHNNYINKKKLINKKQYDKIRLNKEIQYIKDNIRRRQNPMDYKDYYTETEYYY